MTPCKSCKPVVEALIDIIADVDARCAVTAVYLPDGLSFAVARASLNGARKLMAPVVDAYERQQRIDEALGRKEASNES
jgi:hypothetical protein